MHRTKIEWTDFAWNPMTGCRTGCQWCWARKMAHRLKGRFGYPMDDPFKPMFHPDRLAEPHSDVPKRFRSRNPEMAAGSAMIFTVDMGDLGWADQEWVMQIIYQINWR